MSATRTEEQAMHPTVKPVAMVADAIRDCSHRGEIVLDVFGGSGSTLIAAEQSGRRARLLELDPHYCDVIVRRWQEMTGRQARLVDSHETFEALSVVRRQCDEPHPDPTLAIQKSTDVTSTELGGSLT